MDQMSDRLATSVTTDTRTRPDRSPQRRAKASSRLQKLKEKNLTNEQMVAMMDLFETNTAAADMFSSLEEHNVDLRWAWISNKLTHMGHPSLPPRDAAEPELMEM
jgi:hypothetical protein